MVAGHLLSGTDLRVSSSLGLTTPVSPGEVGLWKVNRGIRHKPAPNFVPRYHL